MFIIRGLIGISAIIFIGYLFSIDRRKINWRLVLTGVVFQLIIGIIVFKIPIATSAFRAVSNAFVKFLSFALEGAFFLFGDLARNSLALSDIKHNLGFLFAFQALPIVVFFSAISAALYYLGVLQKIVKAFAWIMTKAMRLSGAESLSAAGNVFLGQTEAPLLVKPFIGKMTKSELHCLMTGGMATIAGSVLGAYVSMLGGAGEEEQIKFASYLLGASLMNAPAAIVLSKLFYPEQKPEDISTDLVIKKENIGVNFIDALARGAGDGLKLALNIGAMLLAFIAVIYCINWFLVDGLGEWTGLNAMVVTSTNGIYDGFSLQYILGQVFRIFAWLMGIDWNQTLYVGSLLGQKLVINEFIAYTGLSELIQQGVLNEKSILISTYSLCGFANFSSIAIQIGGIGSMAPSRQSDLSRMGFRALFAASLATMMTGSIAGIMLG